MTTDAEVFTLIDAAFGDVSKPEHFTNFTHCEECAEHDELLRTRDRDTLRIQDVGNPGWEPLCFSSPAGIAYYMPALVRLALDPPTYEYGWYGDQLLFHLSHGAAENALLKFCNATQKHAVAALLMHFIESIAGIDECLSTEDDIRLAHELWLPGV